MMTRRKCYYDEQDNKNKNNSYFQFFSSRILVLLVLVIVDSTTTDACTVFIVGKDASVDGGTMVTHSNDGEFETDPRLVVVPSQKVSTKSRRPIYFSPESYPRFVGYDRLIPEYYPQQGQRSFEPIGSIPQGRRRTYRYLEETYGVVNEKQVAIGESTCSGVFGAIPMGAPNGTALFSIDALTQIAMERAASAREAIQIIGDLAVEYGFYGAGEFEGTAESLGIVDPQEAWIFHILPDPTGTSAIWVAQRIPSTNVAVLANMFVIRTIDPQDTENYMMSDSVYSVAIDYGWYEPNNNNKTDTDALSNHLLDFTKIYSDGEYAHKYYSGRRIWRGYQMVAPSRVLPDTYVDLQSDPVYPVYLEPDTKLSVQDLFRFHRDTLQTTKYDLGAIGNLAGGPFGSPDRWKEGEQQQQITGNWERPIGLYRTSDTYVVQSTTTNNENQSILWFGPASALGTVFTPFVVQMNDIPKSYRSGHQSLFSRQSAFWAACYVHNVANLKWSYAIQDVQQLQTKLESESIRLLQQKQKTNEGAAALEQALLENAEKIMSSLWELSDRIVFKYASGFVNELPDKMSQQVGYPAWWLDAVGYSDGPPPPPTKPKCCHPAPKNNHSSQQQQQQQNVLTGKAAMKQYLLTTKQE